MAEGGGNETERHSYRSIGSDFVFDFYCEFCKDDGKNVEAEGFCVDCDEYLCEVCYNARPRNRQTLHHQLLDKNKMPKNTPLSPDRINKAISTKCKLHTGKIVKYYCKTHDILGCSSCFVQGHRSCSDVESIFEKSENILDSKEYTEFIETLNSLDRRSRDTIAKARVNITKTKNCHSEVIKAVKLLKEEVNRILDKLEQDIVTEVDTIVSEEEGKTAAISKNCSTVTEAIEKILAEFKSLHSSRRVCQVYISMKESNEHIKILQDKARQAEDTLGLRTFQFDANRDFQDFIKNLPTLGNISCQISRVTERQQTEVNKSSSFKFEPKKTIPDSIERTPSLGKSSNGVPWNTEGERIEAINPAPEETMHVADIDISVTRVIVGSAVISNTRLVTLHYEYSEVLEIHAVVVELLDTQSNKQISELRVSGIPCAITVINNSRLVVTLKDRQKILLLNVSNKMKIDREITVGDRCHGVAFSKNRLVVSYTNPPKLEVMNLSDKVMKKIVKDNDGNQLFQRPLYVCVSKDGETIYVSDEKSNKLTSLTFDGVVKSVYTDPELDHPRGVCVDHHGNVYVCGYCSDKLHMLTADLTKIKIILTKAGGLDGVSSLCHCQETNRLYVGVGSRIKVFQLPYNVPL